MRYERCATAVSVCLVGLLLGTAVFAQQPMTTTTKETRNFEVISVDGNDVVVRLEDGSTKQYTVPEDFRFDVGGQQLSVHALQPGMKGTATITTITTEKPVSVTEVRNATVVQIAGSSIVVRGAKGYRMFSPGDLEKHNVKIIRDGQPVDLSDLRTGDRLTATIITDKPPQVMTQRQVQASLAPGAPSATAGSTGTAGATGSTTAPEATGAAPAAGAPANRELPKTASDRPLVGGIGVVALAIGVALALRRRRRQPAA